MPRLMLATKFDLLSLKCFSKLLINTHRCFVICLTQQLLLLHIKLTIHLIRALPAQVDIKQYNFLFTIFSANYQSHVVRPQGVQYGPPTRALIRDNAPFVK